MKRIGKKARREFVEPEELRARILNVRRRCYISRSNDYENPLIDDEAEIEIEAAIEHISARHQKRLGETMSISLLAANRYAPEEGTPTYFFGSVTMRGDYRSALAYLPSPPFWEIPALIGHGALLIELTFTPMKQGFAHLLSLYVTDEPTTVPM